MLAGELHNRVDKGDPIAQRQFIHSIFGVAA